MPFRYAYSLLQMVEKSISPMVTFKFSWLPVILRSPYRNSSASIKSDNGIIFFWHESINVTVDVGQSIRREEKSRYCTYVSSELLWKQIFRARAREIERERENDSELPVIRVKCRCRARIVFFVLFDKSSQSEWRKNTASRAATVDLL